LLAQFIQLVLAPLVDVYHDPEFVTFFNLHIVAKILP
jgi:hypothetical protein